MLVRRPVGALDSNGLRRNEKRRRSVYSVNRKQKKATLLSGFFVMLGAGNETRTRDPDLGKVVLYQLSYSRVLVVRIL